MKTSFFDISKLFCTPHLACYRTPVTEPCFVEIWQVLRWSVAKKCITKLGGVGWGANGSVCVCVCVCVWGGGSGERSENPLAHLLLVPAKGLVIEEYLYLWKKNVLWSRQRVLFVACRWINKKTGNEYLYGNCTNVIVYTIFRYLWSKTSKNRSGNKKCVQNFC